MKCYIDITLIPDADIALYFLWEKLYQQIHLTLVENKNADSHVNIGVSFPQYNNEKHHLGSKLRLIASCSEDLKKLNLHDVLANLSDYIHMTSIKDVPEKIEGYAFFKRLQVKGNMPKLARRRAKKLDINYEDALAFFTDNKERKQAGLISSNVPFINIKSQSSGMRFRLIIERIETEKTETEDCFSCYGLSSTSSVPLF